MTRFLLKRAPLAAAIMLLSTSIAVAAVEDTKIEKVYVSGTRSESTQLPLATTITVIDAEQIRLSGATQIAEVLRAQAGIQLQDLDGSGGRNVTISLRGFGANAANNTLVMVDGRKLNNPSLAGPALNTIALKDVERIEIVQGSAGVLYGDQAVGGVINIVTRRATRGEIHGSVQALKGSHNLESYTANVNQGFHNGVSYAVSAQKRNADNYRDNNQSAYENLLANLRYDFAGGHVFVEGQKIDDKLRLPGAISDEQAAQDPRQTNNPTHYGNQKTELLRAGGGINLNPQWQLLAEYADRDEDAVSFYGYGEPTAQNMHVKNFTPRVIGRVPSANGDTVITLGYDKVTADYTVPDWWVDIEQDIDGYYGQVIYPVTQKLAVTLGMRRSEVDDRNHIASSTHSDKLDARELGVNYQLDASWRVFARYAEGFRFANADENSSVLPEVDFLNAQISESTETGFAWQGARAEARVTLYRMTTDDEIIYDPLIPNSNSWNSLGANINLPQSQRHGLMLDTEWQLDEQVSVRANYTYTDAELISGSFDGNKVPFVAENTASVALVYIPAEQWNIYVDSTYTGSRYRAGDNANTLEKTAAVTLYNANISWALDDIELGFRVKNIGNKRYTDYQGLSSQYPQPGRTYEASVAYRF